MARVLVGDARARAELEHQLFLVCDGHELGRMLKERIPPDSAHLFATGQRSTSEAERLVAQFQSFAEKEAPDTPVDTALVRFVWSRLGSAKPATVRNYLSRLMTALADRGVRGVRTRAVQQTSKALQRLSVMVRPRQALPLRLEEVREVVAKLEARTHTREAAMVATVWLSRARVPDVRVLTAGDVTEVENAGAADAETVGLQIYLKEKQAKAHSPPEYLPPGPLTARLVRLARQTRSGPLFAESQASYQRSLHRIREAMPHGAAMHSFRRGATQELERSGVDRDGLQQLLRHADSRTTRRYMMTVPPSDVRDKPLTLAPLQ
ncbi:hypothetical protein DIPPA_18024 [Diplonema papillatum]|nr:hypothetical protein DIPPA_18024 [Diplonema papillatum]